MALAKAKKQEIIQELKENLQKQKSVILVDFSGCDSKFLFRLREELEKANCLLKIVKKTLLKKTLEKLAMKDMAEKVEQIEAQLALVFGFQDEIRPAKICYQFSQENENLKILAGVFGKEFVEKEKVIELAQLPSREELWARVVGTLQNPISNFANVLKNNIKGLIWALSAIKETR